MAEDLLIVSVIYMVGNVFFGQFEERTPKLRRLAKIVLLLGITAILSASAGRPWSLIWIAGLLVISVSLHVWWTVRHGINPWTAEPKDKYYALRGWK